MTKPLNLRIRKIIPMKNKAIVIETKEILDVENHYSVKLMSIIREFTDVVNNNHNNTFDENKKCDYYKLSNGKDYPADELVIGLENIREFKLKNIIN